MTDATPADNTNEDDDTPRQLTTLELFAQVRELPIYGKIELHTSKTSQIAKLRKCTVKFDRFCPDCQKETSWTPQVTEDVTLKKWHWEGLNVLSNECDRCKNLEYIWLMYSPNDNELEDDEPPAVLEKVGQSPSLASFHGNDVAEFEKVTTREQRSDYLRAVRAFSQSFSAGACTYLRRVVEGLMTEERANHMKEKGLTEWKEYDSAPNVLKKMQLLGDRLPSFLVENPQLYRVLSQGIHSLSEEECQELFPNLQRAILFLFRQRLRLKRENDEKADLASFIARSDKAGR